MVKFPSQSFIENTKNFILVLFHSFRNWARPNCVPDKHVLVNSSFKHLAWQLEWESCCVLPYLKIKFSWWLTRYEGSPKLHKSSPFHCSASPVALGGSLDMYKKRNAIWKPNEPCITLTQWTKLPVYIQLYTYRRKQTDSHMLVGGPGICKNLLQKRHFIFRFESHIPQLCLSDQVFTFGDGSSPSSQ